MPWSLSVLIFMWEVLTNPKQWLHCLPLSVWIRKRQYITNHLVGHLCIKVVIFSMKVRLHGLYGKVYYVRPDGESSGSTSHYLNEPCHCDTSLFDFHSTYWKVRLHFTSLRLTFNCQILRYKNGNRYVDISCRESVFILPKLIDTLSKTWLHRCQCLYMLAVHHPWYSVVLRKIIPIRSH